MLIMFIKALFEIDLYAIIDILNSFDAHLLYI